MRFAIASCELRPRATRNCQSRLGRRAATRGGTAWLARTRSLRGALRVVGRRGKGPGAAQRAKRGKRGERGGRGRRVAAAKGTATEDRRPGKERGEGEKGARDGWRRGKRGENGTGQSKRCGAQWGKWKGLTKAECVSESGVSWGVAWLTFCAVFPPPPPPPPPPSLTPYSRSCVQTCFRC